MSPAAAVLRADWRGWLLLTATLITQSCAEIAPCGKLTHFHRARVAMRGRVAWGSHPNASRSMWPESLIRIPSFESSPRWIAAPTGS